MTARQTFLVARKELRSFFDQPTAYVLAVAFLGLSLYLTFRSLYAMERATLRPFFDLLPWLLVVFVPAAAMKALAEERRSRTLEWLVAQPLTETDIVLGKFLGTWAFVGLTLAGTLPAAAGVLAASEADPGIMAAQYAGAALLAAQMIAIGLWASAMTGNQITAFILGAFTCFGLVLAGTPVVQIGLPQPVGGWVSQLAVLGHFENVARGVVDLRDLLYFASTSGLFLLLATAVLSRNRLSLRDPAYRRLRIGVGVIAATVLLANLAGERVRGRLDLTRDNLFTLSAGSRDILGGLDDIVNLSLFASDDLPQQIEVTIRDVRDLVADMADASDDMLAVRELNPDDDEDAAAEASSLGISPIEFNVLREDELQVKRGYFGLALTYADEQEVIPVIDRVHDLEFRLVSAVAQMTSDEMPTVAFMSGFQAKEAYQYGQFRESISDRYRITSIDVANDSAGALRPDSIGVLVVAAPAEPVSPAVADAVGAYVDAGGKAFFLMERHLPDPQSPIARPVVTGLESVLARYGVEAPGDMVFDLVSSQAVSMRRGFFDVVQPYPLWPIAMRGDEHATNRDLGNVTFGWAAPFTWDDSVRATALWTTTEGGGTRPGGGMIDPSMQLASSEDELGVHVLAVAVETGAGADAGDAGDAGEGDGEEDAAAGGRIVAVGDADFLEDRFAQASPQNLIFAANAIDWLAQDESLIAIRSKDRTPPALVFESEFSKSALKWGMLAGVPLVFVAVGFARVTGRAARAERRWTEAGGGEAAKGRAAGGPKGGDVS